MRVTIDIDDRDRRDPREEPATTAPTTAPSHTTGARDTGGDPIDAGPPTRPRSLDEEVAEMAPTASSTTTGEDAGGPPDLDSEE